MVFIRSKAFSICAILLTGAIAGLGTNDVSGDLGGSIHISSEPPGADLYVMGKHAGTTPTTISEQDIYPVSYRADTEKLYGMVFLHKNGCEEFSKRLTRTDIKNGLTIRLVCSTGEIASTSPQSPVTPAARSPVVAPSSVATVSSAVVADSPPQPDSQTSKESLSERKLKQLKSLLQLLDEGLMSREEEEQLRRRILGEL